MGEWSTTPLEQRKKTYYVCSWGENDFRSNPHLCGWGSRQGEHLVNGHNQWLMQFGGNAHQCDKRDNTRLTFTKRESYEWVPMLCDLIPWNATQFCSLLGTRKIMNIGDSTMQQSAASLMSRLTTDMPFPLDPTKRRPSCADQIYFGSIATFQEDKNAAVAYVNQVQPDIVILNSGAHWMTTPQFEVDVNVHMQSFLNQVRSTVHGKNITFAWKTMNPGHVDCPNTAPNGPLNVDWSHAHSHDDIYNWWIFAHQDSYMRKNLASMFNITRTVDMSPLYYRQDAHSDCLHYCMPGPVDLYGRLLLQMLYTGEL